MLTPASPRASPTSANAPGRCSNRISTSFMTVSSYHRAHGRAVSNGKGARLGDEAARVRLVVQRCGALDVAVDGDDGTELDALEAAAAAAVEPQRASGVV